MVELLVPELVEIAAGAVSGGPAKIVVGIRHSKEVGEERVVRFLDSEAVEDGDFPPSAAVCVRLDGQ